MYNYEAKGWKCRYPDMHNQSGCTCFDEEGCACADCLYPYKRLSKE